MVQKNRFSSPNNRLNVIARRLEELGYREAVGINSLALKLHRYAYNGLYRGASDYADRKDAIEDLVVLIKKLTQLIAELGREKEANEILKKIEGPTHG
ncbi:PaREP1 family protein [Vulcanisaeta sp. JCM 16159]|uniref:PaREP1 family protein n=1 Tax=Vulcanisaeta sp. JCM 16159 TaxID=1295371 RepID=UPI000AE09C60